MATREEKIAFLQSQDQASGPSRADKIAFLQAQDAQKSQGSPGAGSSLSQTALEGFGQGASLGYLPELQAAASKPIYKVLNYLTGQDVQPDSYQDELARNVQRQSDQAAANRKTALASKVAGSIASAVATSPLLPAPAATIGGRLQQAGRIGTVLGAVGNTGHNDGINLPARIENAGKGLGEALLTAGLLESPGIARAGANGLKNAVANKLDLKINYTPIENAAEVTQAAKNLGIKEIPKGVLTDNPTYQKLESGLSQSGSFPARQTKTQYNDFFKGLDKATEKISDLKTPESTFAIGSDAKATLANEIQSRQAPVSEMYTELNKHLKNIPVDEGVVNKAFGALKKDPMFQTKDGAAMLEEYKGLTKEQPDLASLKEFRTSVRDSVSKTAPPIDIKRAQALRSTITKVRDNSVNALKADLPPDAHPEIDNLIDQISLADQAHASNVKDLNSIKSLIGNKEFDSPSTFIKQLGSMSEEQLAKRMGNLDVSTMRNLQEKFPEIYNKAKIAKVNDMISNSSSPVSGFNETRFLKQYSKMPQEMRDLVFPKEIQSHLADLATVKGAIPEKLGPSGTPEGLMTMDMFSPKRNALDYGIKKALESTARPMSTPAAPGVSKTANVLKLLAAKPSTSQEFTGQVSAPAAADNQPKKGPAKWANDGFENLKEHASEDDKDALDKMKGAMLKSPAGKNLLISASDLKPKSKAMALILERAKDKFGGEK